MQFVVRPKPLLDQKSLKVFEALSTAIAYAKKRVSADADEAEVLRVKAEDARQALAAVGNGEFTVEYRIEASPTKQEVDAVLLENLAKKLGL